PCRRARPTLRRVSSVTGVTSPQTESIKTSDGNRRAYQPNDHLIRGGWSAWSNRIGGHDRRFRTCVGLACTLAHRSSYYRSCSSSVQTPQVSPPGFQLLGLRCRGCWLV